MVVVHGGVEAGFSHRTCPPLGRRAGVSHRPHISAFRAKVGKHHFTLSTVEAQAQSTSKSPEERARGASATHLADMFCRMARRRVEERFDRLFDNDDMPIYRTAQMVMANEMTWLENQLER